MRLARPIAAMLAGTMAAVLLNRWLRSFVEVLLRSWTPELRRAVDLTMATLERMQRVSASHGVGSCC